MSFQVPVMIGERLYSDVSRTLCTAPNASEELNTFFIDLSTLSSRRYNFTLSTTVIDSSQLKLDWLYFFFRLLLLDVVAELGRSEYGTGRASVDEGTTVIVFKDSLVGKSVFLRNWIKFICYFTTHYREFSFLGAQDTPFCMCLRPNHKCSPTN